MTVDPSGDTVAVLADYWRYFHPVIQGWRGSEGAIAKTAKGFAMNDEPIPS